MVRQSDTTVHLSIQSSSFTEEQSGCLMVPRGSQVFEVSGMSFLLKDDVGDKQDEAC